jgi:uncharacterized membrane protein YfcA
VTEAAALAVAAAGICVGALSSGAVGLGFPIVVIPALALGYGLETAVVVSALPAFAIDLANLIDTRAERHASRGLVRFGAVSAVAAVVGSLAVSRLNETVLALILAGAIGAFIAIELVPQLQTRGMRGRSGDVVAPVLGGLLQSTVGISSPVTATYFLNRTTTRASFIFHLTTIFVLVGAVRLVVLAGAGTLGWERLGAGLGLTAAGLAGRSLGARLGRRLDATRFRRAVVWVVAGSLVPLLAQVF